MIFYIYIYTIWKYIWYDLLNGYMIYSYIIIMIMIIIIIMILIMMMIIVIIYIYIYHIETSRNPLKLAIYHGLSHENWWCSMVVLVLQGVCGLWWYFQWCIYHILYEMGYLCDRNHYDDGILIFEYDRYITDGQKIGILIAPAITGQSK